MITLLLSREITELSRNTGPAAQAAAQLLGGIHRSFSSLRGWVALADERFRCERAETWADEILPISLEELSAIAAREDSLLESDQMDRIARILADLEESQWWVEDIAHTPGDMPATTFSRDDATPVAERLLAALKGLPAAELPTAEARALREHLYSRLALAQVYLLNFINEPGADYAHAFRRAARRAAWWKTSRAWTPWRAWPSL